MCTVTYVPCSDGYFLVSNRDEKYSRKKALLPSKYILSNKAVVFPKDADAGGTWMILKENGDSLCLLNGAFNKIIDSSKYHLSRGKIVLEIAASADLITAFKSISLINTAPFTLVVVYKKNLWECIWDGETKQYTSLDEQSEYIWSSVTLYDSGQQKLRQQWFKKWLKETNAITLFNLFEFHKKGGDGNQEIDLIMNRENKLFTVSITGIAVHASNCLMQYLDLSTNGCTQIGFMPADNNCE